jgi:hypothetical protein
MNPGYVATYRRHRRLFLLPILIVAGLALWSVLGAPKVYQSSANLWSGAVASTNETLGAPPPAAQEQTMLNELLKTQYFQRDVAQKSHLSDYLASHPSAGWGPGVFISKLRPAKPLEDRVAAALGPKRVTSLVQGPHVLKISYNAPTPALAVATLKALLSQYEKQRGLLSRDALTAYQTTVAAATKSLGDARASVANFLRQNPAGSSDPQYKLLLHAERDAATRLAGATDTLSQASTDVLNQVSAQPNLRVVDPPSAAISPTSKLRKGLVALFAGIFGGVLISCLGVVALTKIRRPAVGVAEPAPVSDISAPLDQEAVNPERPAAVMETPMESRAPTAEPAPAVRDEPIPVAPAPVVEREFKPVAQPAPAPPDRSEPDEEALPVVEQQSERREPIEKASSRSFSAVSEPPPTTSRPAPEKVARISRRKRRIREVTPEVVPEILPEPRAGGE